MYAWVADSKEAVFVIPAFAPKYLAHPPERVNKSETQLGIV
jgi:hypothetical protein